MNFCLVRSAVDKKKSLLKSLPWGLFAMVFTAFAIAPGEIFAQNYKASPQLDAVHPGFDLASLRPDGFKPQVVGLDFMSDGRMVLLNFRPHEVYMVTGVETGDRSKVKRTKYASAGTGFPDEPLGMTVKDDTVFVIDRARLVKLVDSDNDGVSDQFVTVCKSWGIDLVNGRQRLSRSQWFSFGCRRQPLVYRQSRFVVARE